MTRPAVRRSRVRPGILVRMCGIVGYIGQPQSDREHGALDVLMEGLRRLEYRGYDSAGVAVVDGGQLYHRKKAGKLANLAEELAEHPIPTGLVGIGHTRWATHGGPTDRNAHPHVADEGRLALIHNGIIENYAELREELLAKGVEFLSETDTEVAAHLLADVYRHAAGQDLTVVSSGMSIGWVSGTSKTTSAWPRTAASPRSATAKVRAPRARTSWMLETTLACSE